MRYLLLIYSQEPTTEPSEAELGEIMNAYNAYTKDLQDGGVFLAGEALQPTNTATTVRVKDGKTLTTDGPFAETKEALGGYYVIEAKNLDDAIMIAAKCPGARFGSMEVRPIVDFPS